jgi:hypothetical protein
LVNGGGDLGAWVVKELLQMLDAKVGDTNVSDLARGEQLLHLLPIFSVKG